MNERSKGNLWTPLFLALFLFFLVRPAFAAAYYVDFTNGSDANDGLGRDTAWRTIPGTKSGNGASRYLHVSWGSGTSIISPGRRITAGDTILLKSGTTYTGGCIYLTSLSDGFYTNKATASNPIAIAVDKTWGNGAPVVFDAGTNDWTPDETAAFLLVLGVSGVTIDGKSQGGILFRNSGVGTILVRATASALKPQIQGYRFRNLDFLGNGANVSAAVDCPKVKGKCLAYAASQADIMLKDTNDVIIERCTFDGTLAAGGVSNLNGVMVGDYDNRNLAVNVSNCIARNHSRDISVDDDHAIGFKANNGQITFTGCSSYNNNKGFDLTDHCSANGCQVEPGNVFKVVSCEAYHNNWGVNFVNTGISPAPPTSGPLAADFYLINSIIRDNALQGSNIYAGPFNAYIVHNVYDHNGTSGLYEAGHLAITSDYESGSGTKDVSTIRAHVYNNIFYNQGASPDPNHPSSTFVEDWWWPTQSNLNWESDYNDFYLNSSKAGNFAKWGGLSGSTPSEMTNFRFGRATGPGWKKSAWFAWYGGSTTAPSIPGCIGHHGSDNHSKGTGASDASLPSFADYGSHDYHLRAALTGLNLSSKPWYIQEMGIDRDGAPRRRWNMGAYERIARAHRPPP